MPASAVQAVLTVVSLAAESSGSSDVAFVQGLPPAGHVALAVAFLGGLVLWAFGAKVIKPIFAVTGLIIGAFAGMLLAAVVGVGTVAGIGGWVIAALIGAAIGLVVALVLTKLAIIFTAAGAFGLVGVGLGLVYVQLTGGPTDVPRPDKNTLAPADAPPDRDGDGRLLFEDPISGNFVTLADLLGEYDRPLHVEKAERARVIAARLQAVSRSALDLFARRWHGLSTNQRVAFVGAMLGGVAFGLVAGFFLPKRSTALITAIGGSATLLIAGVGLVEGVPWFAAGRPYVQQSPTAWGVVWVVVAALGLVVQLCLLQKPRSSGKGDSK